MAMWLAGQTAPLTARVLAPTWMQVFSAVQGHCTTAFYDAITVPTEFIISVVNSVKVVNMPLAWVPLLKEGKSLSILLLGFDACYSGTVLMHMLFILLLQFFILLLVYSMILFVLRIQIGIDLRTNLDKVLYC